MDLPSRHAVASMALLTLGCAATAAGACPSWPLYTRFVAQFVDGDGRVLDYATPVPRTTSEGQAYGMFFALVANDRPTFDRLLAWTRKHLAANRFEVTDMTLPAWLWGARPDGSVGVVDPNAAADADLWLAYDLLQAGRLWHSPEYTALGRALAARIVRDEVVDVAGLGAMLLPAPNGFRTPTLTRLNPSYLPLPVLRGLASIDAAGPWHAIAQNTLTLLQASAPHGFAPDWVAWQAGRFAVDSKTGDLGSYDAIRVYLWAGLSSSADALAKPWLAILGGMGAKVAQTGIAPERVATTTGDSLGEGPLAYWGALAPYLAARGDAHEAALARVRLDALEADAPPGQPPVYYDRVLGLFGTGFIDGRYRFDANGHLVPTWRNRCD